MSAVASRRRFGAGRASSYRLECGLITAGILEQMIESELATVTDNWVVQHIRGMLVQPHVVPFYWDYGEPGQQFPCWIVLLDARSGSEIAYCEYGFGPHCPWGLVNSGDRQMGMDSGWYPTFLDAFFESFACVALPIWQVFRVEADGKRTALTEEGPWDATWHRVYELRGRDPSNRYECDHGINFGPKT